MTRCVSILAVLFAFTSLLRADIKTDKPADVCKYLEKQSLHVSKYGKIGTDSYFGTTEKNLTEKDPPAKITYTLESEVEDKVQTLTLLISVEDPADARDAEAQLILCAKVLLPKAIGAEVPAELIQSIKDRKDGKWKLGAFTARIDCWKSDKSSRYTIGLQLY